MKKGLISLVLMGTSFLGNAIAEERKFYLTGSGGVSWLRDQDVDIDAAYQNDFGTKVIDYFDPDLNFEIGIGYDLGKFRMEGTYSQGDNNLRKADTVDRNLYTEWTKGTITNQSWNLGFYYDFNSDKKFTPYLGGGIGTTKLNLVGIQEKWNDSELPTDDDFESYSRMSYFGKIGVSYKMNKNSDVFLESTYRVLNDIKREVGNYPNPQTYALNFGLRYRY